MNFIYEDKLSGTLYKSLISPGQTIKTYDYDAFGNEKNLSSNDTNVFRFCGEYFDKEAGTIYLRARYYDPSIGRFISEDSNEGQLTNPLSLNLYTYCMNDPVKYVDPTGNFAALVVQALESPSGQQLMAKAGVLVTEFGEFVTLYGAQLENQAIAAIDKGKEIAGKGANWLKSQLSGSGGQDPNKWNKKVSNINYKISEFANDWQTKGFHLKIDGVEIAMKPGQNGTIVFKQVFSNTSSRSAQVAINKAYQLLQDPSIRQQFYARAVSGRDYLANFGTEAATAKAGELSFLIKALEKLGVK